MLLSKLKLFFNYFKNKNFYVTTEVKKNNNNNHNTYLNEKTNEYLGAYVSIGVQVYKIVNSTKGNSGYISLYNEVDGLYARHQKGVIKNQFFADTDTFKNDSSFRMVNEGNAIIFYCTNKTLTDYVISIENGYPIIKQFEKAKKLTYKFYIINNKIKDISEALLFKVSNLEEKINTLSRLFNMHHPIDKMPPTCGNLRLFQEDGIELLRVFDSICRKNKLSYWIDYGTLLGAVRHKGYIPWDDDLDVCMMYDDFCKLEKIIDDEMKDEQMIYTHNFHPYIYKIISTKKKSGNAWLDIFPFYYMRNDISEELFNENFKKSRVARRSVIKQQTDDAVRTFALDFNNKYMTTDNTDRIFRGFQAADNPLCDIRKYSNVFPLVELEFEGLRVYAPNSYLEKLKSQYGNFWLYPDKPVSHRSW